MRIIITLPLLLIFLVSCSPARVSPVSTVAAANTVSPTETKTPYPTLTANPTATATLSMSATPSATPDPAIQILNSPDSKYVAKLYSPINMLDKPVIKIFDEQNKLLRQIPYQGEVPEGDPKPSLTIYEWSTDSSQLYFYYVWSPDGGDWAFWWTGYDLQKIDMKTGKLQRVLPGQGSMSFAISPDGTQIAYTRAQDEPSIIYVRNLVSGAVKKAKVLSDSKNYVRVGDIYWSASGQNIAFQTETDDYMVQTIYLNPVTMKQKVIKEYELFTLFFQGWSDDGKLEFLDYEHGNRIIHINPGNDETVVIGTPTSRP